MSAAASLPLCPEAVGCLGARPGEPPRLGPGMLIPRRTRALLVQTKTAERAPLKDIWENAPPPFCQQVSLREGRGQVESGLRVSLGLATRLHVKSRFVLTSAGREMAVLTVVLLVPERRPQEAPHLGRAYKVRRRPWERIPGFPGRSWELRPVPVQCEAPDPRG